MSADPPTSEILQPIMKTRPRLVLSWLLVAVAYLAGGLLSIASGLVTAGPDGIAAVVWLPPGIALAAILACGKRVWPGVWLGSAVMCALMARADTASVGIGTAAGIGVLLGTTYTLQAIGAAVLVRRLSGAALTLDRPRSVFGFLLCSVISALVSSTAGSLMLVAIGLRSMETFVVDWPSWWVSDAISVFLVTPVLLSWVAAPAHLWRPRRRLLTLPLGLALILVAVAFVQATRLDRDRAHKDFELTADEIEEALDHALDRIAEGAEVIRDVQSAARVDPGQFRRVASRLRVRNLGLGGVGWIPRVIEREREAHERAMQLAGHPGYRITELDQNRKLVPALPRADYYPVDIFDAEQSSVSLLGLDMASMGARRRLFEAAQRRGELTMSEPTELVAFPGRPTGVLIALPVAEATNPGAVPGAVRGLVLCVVRIDTLAHHAIGSLGRNLDVRIEDEQSARGKGLVFETRNDSVPDARLPYRALRHLPNGGRSWRIELRPTRHYLLTHRSFFGTAVSMTGFALAALLCGFLLVTTGHAAETQQLVAERTRELSRAVTQLRDEITTHERTEKALKESETRWQFALEEAGDGVWDFDLPRGLLYWSPRLREVLGLGGERVDDGPEKWRDATHPDDLPEAQQLLERHLRGETPAYEFELRMRHKLGHYVWFLTRAKVVERDRDGRPLRVIGTQTDISARKQVEEALRAHRERLEELVHERTAELEVAKTAAEAANRAKSAFLANMSHELRTPMHAVLAYARLGLDKATDPKLRDFLDRIVGSGERLLMLLNDLLDLSKLEAGKMQVDFAQEDLEELVRDVARELEPLFVRKALRLEIERGRECVRCTAAVDSKRIAQVVHNIFSNAVRFSSQGATIRVVFDRTSLTTEGDAGAPPRPAIEIAISDQGVGIPEEELELIFDKFVQSSKTRTSAGGTGLGLAICRQIAQLHRGTVKARNNPGGGATFVVTLPIDARSEVDEGAAA